MGDGRPCPQAKLLEGLGLTRKEAAALLGTTPSSITELYRRRRSATPDDEARLKTKFRNASDASYEKDILRTGEPRPNVLFEAGRAFGSHPDTQAAEAFARHAHRLGRAMPS